MAKRADDLLAQIELDVLDESKSVASALRKCVVLGGRAGSADLREWATRELRGYRTAKEELPDYRRIQAPLLMDGMSGLQKVTGESISVIDLPEFARDDISDELPLTQGIGVIEDMIRQADSKGGVLQLGPPAGAELARMMTHELGDPSLHIERVYWSVSIVALRGVMDAVRTALAELVGELRAGMAEGEQAPSAELAEQAFQIAVRGNKNRVIVTHARASDGGPAIAAPQMSESEESGFWTTTRRVWAAIGVLAGIVAAVAAVLALH